MNRKALINMIFGVLFFITFIILVMLLGCSEDKFNYNNLYLFNCSQNDNCEVVVDINLPEGFYAVLYHSGNNNLAHTIVENGIYNIGVIHEHETTLTLELILRDCNSGDKFITGRAYDGLEEYCTIELLQCWDPIVPQEPDIIEQDIVPEDSQQEDNCCNGHKILVCKNGKELWVPLHVAERWEHKGKAIIGKCD